MRIFVYSRVFLWEPPHFLKISRCIIEVTYSAWYTEYKSICIVWKWSSTLSSLTISKLINLSTPCQCLYISDLSKQIFDNFLNSSCISSHQLQQVSYDNLLSSKAIWRLFIASENPPNWFMSVVFKRASHFSKAFTSRK